MMKRKTVWVLTFLGIFLMLSYIVLGHALVLECSWENGPYSTQKVVVASETQKDPEGSSSFSDYDVRRLKKELSTSDISSSARSGLINTFVSKGGNTFPVKLTGTDPMYPMFNNMTLKKGSFITQKHEEEGAMVAVIDEELAEDIFNSTDITGMSLDIFGSTFTIIGVVKKDDSLIGKLTDDGLPDVYIPSKAMLEIDNTAHITSLQIKTAGTDTLDQYTNSISEALSKIGKDVSKYSITDYNLKYAMIRQGPLLFIFILGIAAILHLLGHAKRIIKRLFSMVRDGVGSDYLVNILRHNWPTVGGSIIQLAFISSGIVLIWLGISFKPYIPPQYIPDELIDLPYYMDLIKSAVQGGIQSMGYIAPLPELIANTTGHLLNLFFFICVLLGPMLLYLGFRELSTANIDISKQTLVCSLFYILSFVVLAAAAYLAGLPFLLELKGVLVLWAFIFLEIFKTTNKVKRGIEND